MNSASITVHTSRVHGRKLQITMDDWSNHRADRACMICVSSSLVKRYSASARSPLSYLHHLDGSCKTMIQFPTIDSFETAYTACQSDRIHSILDHHNSRTITTAATTVLHTAWFSTTMMKTCRTTNDHHGSIRPSRRKLPWCIMGPPIRKPWMDCTD